MLGLKLDKSEPLNVLCLGAHCDDIEIGCGGTILELSGKRPVNCTWVVFCSNEVRAIEAQKCAEYFLRDAEQSNMIIKNFTDGFLPYLGCEVKEEFEELKKQIKPDIIFTHYGKDKHQDHRIVSELTLNTFRDHMIFEYEIPKYDGDLGQPNGYSPISIENVRVKIDYLMKCYASQKNKYWFSPDLFQSLMRVRGMEVNAPELHAEAFYCTKFELSL